MIRSSVQLFALIFSSIISVGRGWANHTLLLTDIDFVSAAWSTALTVVMVGYNDNHGAIIRSIDAGLSWTSVSASVAKMTDVATITTSGTQRFLGVATNGNIYSSTNNGLDFTKLVTITAELYGISIGSNGNAFAVGVTNFPSAGKVYFVAGGGMYTIWKEISPKPAAPVLFTAVTSFDGIRAIVVGYSGYIYYTADSGIFSGFHTDA